MTLRPAHVNPYMSYASVNGLQLYYEPRGRPAAPLAEDLLPTEADRQLWQDAYRAVAPDPEHFDELTAQLGAMVQAFPGWTDELRSLRMPVLLIFGDRDFMPLPDVVEMLGLLPDALITPFLEAR
jgi:pimeloyl-ACP methyl ester carboxylesterase